ncbi:MAG: hypothetical protein ACLRVE_07315 [Finegoldia magna]
MMFMTPNVTMAEKVEATPQAVEAKVESIKANYSGNNSERQR